MCVILSLYLQVFMDKVLAYPCAKGELASATAVASYIENVIIALFKTEVHTHSFIFPLIIPPYIHTCLSSDVF
jgi:hypothetical protein